MNQVIEYALRNRLLVVIFLISVIAAGVYQYDRLPTDAFPDISPVMVPVFAEAHGMAPEEIERLITFPIESAMNGLPGVELIKSTSAFGMAVVYVYSMMTSISISLDKSLQSGWRVRQRIFRRCTNRRLWNRRPCP